LLPPPLLSLPQFFPDTPISQLNPLDPKRSQDRVLTAWNAQPVFHYDNTDMQIPDGLLLLGQVGGGGGSSSSSSSRHMVVVVVVAVVVVVRGGGGKEE